MRNALDFSMREKRGIVVLLLIMLLCIVLPEFSKRVESTDRKELIEASYLQYLELVEEEENKVRQVQSEVNKRFYFDPNVVREEEMNLLGFPEYVSKRIVKYRASGGAFRTRADLKKIYGMPEKLYVEIEPWIRIPEKVEKKEEREVSRMLFQMDLNESDSSDFVKLKGIGPVYASRIIKYRKALGGYVSVDQLKEVYGVKDSLFNALLPFILLDSSFQIEKIPINSINKKQLSLHPYFRMNRLAGVIVNYRTKHGPYRHADDLLKIHVISDSVLNKISPYLDFQ